MAVVAELSKIPPFPPVAAELLRVMADDEAETEQLAAIIQGDPILTAELLQRANSPALGIPQKVETVRHAITLLGLDRIRRIATTILASSYTAGLRGSDEYLRCWRHTLATAFLSEEVAWAFGEREDRAYVGGLLHDIGRLALLVKYPNEYGEILRRANREPVDTLELERAAFGIDHCEAGRHLAEMWNLPLELVVVAGRHHDQLQHSDGALLYYAHMGCRMADALGYSAVTPRQHATIDDLRALLPPEAQLRFCQDVLALHDALEAEIEAYAGQPPDRPDGLEPQLPEPITIALPIARPEPAPQEVRISNDLLIYLLSAAAALFAVVWFSLR